MAEREVPRYLPKSFPTSSGPALLQGTQRLLQILTHSVTGISPELLLKNICQIRPVANSISTTQFHLRKLITNGGNSKETTQPQRF